MKKREIHTKYWLGSAEGKRCIGRIGISGTIILKPVVRK
jgi:hypothetical protein